MAHFILNEKRNNIKNIFECYCECECEGKKFFFGKRLFEMTWVFLLAFYWWIPTIICTLFWFFAELIRSRHSVYVWCVTYTDISIQSWNTFIFISNLIIDKHFLCIECIFSKLSVGMRMCMRMWVRILDVYGKPFTLHVKHSNVKISYRNTVLAVFVC